MVHSYKTVIFDLDGTILDTSEGIIAAAQYTIDTLGYKPLTEEQLKEFIGPPVQVSFERKYNLSKEEAWEAAAVFRNRYKDADLLKAVPYAGIFELFQALNDAGIKPAIATYKREDYAKKLLRHFGFDQYTDVIFGSDMEGKLTKRDIIELAVKSCAGCEVSDAVMIGDSDNDAIGASAMGMDFIGVTYGFGFKDTNDVNAYQNVGSADSTEKILELVLGE